MFRKKIQIEDAKKGYLKFGHGVYRGKNYNEKNPNYMWGYTKSKVSKWAETPECTGHADIKGWVGGEWSFWGRYDAKKRTISCVIGEKGANPFRKLPRTVVSQLEQCFPNAKKIVVFD